jgi:hypothetical protein
MIPGRPEGAERYCVPNLCFDDLRLQLDDFRGKLDAQCGLVIVLENTLDVSGEEAGLADV